MAALVGHGNTVSSCSSHPWTSLLWALLTLLSQVWGFNLDTTHTLHKLGDHGTFFGFSLALHQQINPEPQSWWVDECGTECALCVLYDFLLHLTYSIYMCGILYLHLLLEQNAHYTVIFSFWLQLKAEIYGYHSQHFYAAAVLGFAKSSLHP